jgi:hypothetical protein
VEKFICMGMTLSNKNCMEGEANTRLNSGMLETD